MFSGIVEVTSKVLSAAPRTDVLEVQVAKPQDFSDVRPGDSIAVNGVCLTVEALSADMLQFALAAETLRITQWSAISLLAEPVNLERSLRFGDRVHGHFVSGHVDFVARIISVQPRSETMDLRLEVPDSHLGFFWPKGSLALNGVSLTINEVFGHMVGVGLIPETMKRTNLGALKAGHTVTVEVDSMARAMMQVLRSQSRPYHEDQL